MSIDNSNPVTAAPSSSSRSSRAWQEEAAFHEQFAPYRIDKTEQFRPGPRLIEFLEGAPIVTGPDEEMSPTRHAVSAPRRGHRDPSTNFAKSCTRRSDVPVTPSNGPERGIAQIGGDEAERGCSAVRQSEKGPCGPRVEFVVRVSVTSQPEEARRYLPGPPSRRPLVAVFPTPNFLANRL